MITHRVAADERGRPVLVKEADASGAARLRREVAVLRAAAHPGVVAVVAEHLAGAGGVAVHLALAGTRTAADLGTDLAATAAFAASLAETVADLHSVGIVHGRIQPEHVIVDAAGRPVLCGFAEAAWRDEPEPGDPVERLPADDVAALGALLRLLVAAPGAPPATAHRRRAGRADADLRRALLTLADHAANDEPARRPTARALAAAIVAAIPQDRPSARRTLHFVRPQRAGRILTPVAGAVGLGLLVFGIGGLLRPVPAPAPRAAGAAAPPPVPATVIEPTTSTTPSIRPPAPPGCPAVAAPAADPDGDGCPSPAHIAAGVVEVDGIRYRVGDAADAVAVGDWDCDGSATVAVAQTTSGAVFVFDDWARPGADVLATPVATIDGVRHLATGDPDRDGCPALVAIDGGGRQMEVPM